MLIYWSYNSQCYASSRLHSVNQKSNIFHSSLTHCISIPSSSDRFSFHLSCFMSAWKSYLTHLHQCWHMFRCSTRKNSKFNARFCGILSYKVLAYVQMQYKVTDDYICQRKTFGILWKLNSIRKHVSYPK